MHIKFTKHGKGCPRKAVSYLLADKDAKGDLRPEIQTLRGDAKTFVAIAESLDFDYRYSSAVIAWSKDDNPTDAQIQETLDQFEKHAFADLDPTRYHMNAVLHVAQDGSKHVHILVPRVDLATGKSLNIAPPGHNQYFDKLRDYLNEKYSWSKPDDLAILKADVQLPHHTHSQRAAAVEINFSGKTKPEKKELLNKIIAQRINAGVIQDRTDVVQTLLEYGIITRNIKDTVSVKLHGDNTAIKMSGEFYKDGFNVTAYAESRARAEANQSASRTNEVDAKRVEQLYNKLQRATESRARYFADKYPTTLGDHRQRDITALSAPDQQRTRSSRVSPEADVQINRVTESSKDRSEASRKPEYSEPRATASTTDTAENQSNFVRIMHSVTANSDHNFIGEVNERIRKNNSEASRLDANTECSIAATYRAIETEKRFIAEAESGFSASSFTIRIETAFTNLVSEIRAAGAKVFTRQVSDYAKKFRHGFIDQRKNRSPDSTASERYSAYSISIDPSPFENFYNDYERKQRARLKRDQREAYNVREVSERFDATVRKSNAVLNRLQSPSFVLKPRSSIETAHIFKYIYISTANDVVYWANAQEMAFHKMAPVGSQLVSAMLEKYNALSNYRMQERDLTPEKVEAISAIIRNDKQMIEFATKRFKTYISKADLDQLNSKFDSTERHFQKDIQSVPSQAPTLETPTAQAKPKQPIDYDAPSP